MFKSRGSVLAFDILYDQDIQTQYSGSHDSCVKMIKTAGAGWQLF